MFRDVLFPDVKGFRPPDRAMSATDQRVGERLAQGMNITEATREGDAESNMMVDRDEDYNTRYGGYTGYLLAFERTKMIPRQSGADRSDRDGAGRRRGHGGQGRRPLRSALPRGARSRTRIAPSLVGFLRGKLGTVDASSRARRSKTRCASCSIWC